LQQQVGTHPSVLVGAALHSVRGVPVEHMPAVVEWAASHGVPLHVHSSEQTREVEECLAVHGRTPTAVLRDVGALGPRSTAVHSTHLTAEDIVDLDRTATGVCFCPTTERDLGDGTGPAPALLAGRGLFSLGSDSHAVIDLFEEARAVELNERLASQTRGTIAANRLLRAATYDGHRALGWAEAGELAVGARADFVAVQMDSIRTAGGGTTVENVVFAAAAPDVTEVVIDGRAVVVDRKHVTMPNAEAELASAIADLMDTSVEATR
jgi:formiminoglutamate deiminase